MSTPDPPAAGAPGAVRPLATAAGERPLVLGLTGPNASGKGVTATRLAAAHGFTVVSLSDVVREEARQRGLPPERAVLIRIGTELRRAHGPGVLAERVLETLRPPALVDSIRNPAEVAALRRLPGFVLVSIEAPAELRFERSMQRGRPGDPVTLAEFLRREAEENATDPNAQQLRATAALADRVLPNDGSVAALESGVDALLARLLASPESG